jgi:ribosomal protein S18 acetylase RimI-like enzyme
MSNPLRLVIRDGIAVDIKACIALDHSYETEFVWQVSIEREDPSQYQTRFRMERLPRTMDVTYPSDELRLRLALPTQHCFLVAAGRDEEQPFGYLTMRQEPNYGIAFIQDIVVSRPFRRNRIGTRLLEIARKWAQERKLIRLIAEVQTKNYPAIAFCQNAGLSFCGYNERLFGNQDVAVFFGQTLR